MGTTPSEPRPRGRPRGFNDEAALDAAMRVFWASGYDGTSVDVLCRATHMSRASLYQSYGGKEELFLAAIGHYVETRVARVAEALGPNGTLAQDLSAFFSEVVRLATTDPATPGCLVSCVLADVAGTNPIFRDELNKRFLALENRICDRLNFAGWSKASVISAPVAAGLAAAMARGIMLRARAGHGPSELAQIADAAVCAVLNLAPVTAASETLKSSNLPPD